MSEQLLPFEEDALSHGRGILYGHLDSLRWVGWGVGGRGRQKATAPTRHRQCHVLITMEMEMIAQHLYKRNLSLF